MPPGGASSLAFLYDAVFLDLDGVVYRGDQAVPGAPEVLLRLWELGCAPLFLTNNSSRTPEQVASKLAALGVHVSPDEVLTSGLATAARLRREGAAGQTAFVIGERGIREALRSADIRILEGAPDQADMVIVGWDRGVNYDTLRTAALLVQRGARLIATNADATYPAPNGLWPGAGSILAAVTTATGATPVVVGKPARPLFEEAAEMTGAKRPLVVGDRLDTDVGGAAGMGWDSVLVLTGAARLPDLPRATHLPTYLGADLRVLLDQVPPARFRLATENDVGPIQKLLAAVDLAATGVEDRLESTVVSAGDGPPSPDTFGDSAIDATASLELAGRFGILRSVAVHPGAQGKGLGVLAVAAAAGEARQRDLSGLALFTVDAEQFFVRLGFRRVDRADLPEEIRHSPQALQECPATAAAMMLDLQIDEGSPRRQ